MSAARGGAVLVVISMLVAAPRAQTAPPAAPAKVDPRVDRLKTEAAAAVDGMAVFTQQMVDQIFSYGELGFQEQETHRYLVDILKKNGFAVEEGIAGIPTAFMATWGSGKPVIALGSDIDGIPQSSQKPGVAYHDPLIEGAPGHGEGHNSGQAVNVTAAIAVKKIMEREKLPGTIRIWPGTAEELLGSKAYFVREGFFKDVDVAMFSHVGNELAVSWGDRGRDRAGVGRVLVPGRDRPLRRRAVAGQERARRGGADEHRLELPARAPAARTPLPLRDHQRRRSANVVPRNASVWYYFRQTTLPEDQGALEDRRRHGQGGVDDDRDRVAADARARHGVAAAFQQDGRRSDLGQHPEGRHAEMERCRSDAGQGAPERARLEPDRSGAERRRKSCRAR